MPNPEFVTLVQQATLAASSHNTQPWKFRLEPGRISIRADFSRRCPAVDPDDHHLFASLGCAAENLILAARAVGLAGHACHDDDDTCVSVSFEAAPPESPPRFAAIPARQCSRSRYDGSSLTARAGRAGRGERVDVSLLTSRDDKDQVAEFVAAGNRAQFGDAGWAREMRRWLRFNARRTCDGLYGPLLGIPRVPRVLGELLMPLAASATRQSHKDALDIRSSGAIAVLSSEASDRRHWVEAGRACERLALEATALGLRVALINQPVEVSNIRAQFAAFLGIADRRPDLVLRFGRGPATPRSLQRPVEQVIEGTP